MLADTAALLSQVQAFWYAFEQRTVSCRCDGSDDSLLIVSTRDDQDHLFIHAGLPFCLQAQGLDHLVLAAQIWWPQQKRSTSNYAISGNGEELFSKAHPDA